MVTGGILGGEDSGDGRGGTEREDRHAAGRTAEGIRNHDLVAARLGKCHTGDSEIGGHRAAHREVIEIPLVNQRRGARRSHGERGIAAVGDGLTGRGGGNRRRTADGPGIIGSAGISRLVGGFEDDAMRARREASQRDWVGGRSQGASIQLVLKVGHATPGFGDGRTKCGRRGARNGGGASWLW